MHQLSPFTCRRLSQLPRLSSVWECDRRPLATMDTDGPSANQSALDMVAGDEDVQGDCIMWADALHGVVRGLSVVPPETGHEAIVRTLLQAIETPQGGVEPARPRKVVVRDREIQFFLRGALQDLNIPVEYVSVLPVIDEVFDKIQTPEPPEETLPEAFEKPLLEKAALLWKDAPWQYLSEQEILTIELNCWEIETLYLSVLGLAGMEYGLLFYRDLSSLQQFRHKLVNSQDFSNDMKQAFLEQNCLFINFNPSEDVIPLHTLSLADERSSTGSNRARKERNDPGAVDYEFGSLHPFEGLRSQLAEEEAASLIVTLEALHRFLKKHDVGEKDFALKPVSSRFRIANPMASTTADQTADKTTLALQKKTDRKASTKAKRRAAEKADKTQDTDSQLPDKISVKVSTLPEVSALFLEEALGSIEPPNLAPLIDDSVPEGALVMLGSHLDKRLQPLRKSPRIYYQSFLETPEQRPGDKAKWPVLTIQTTRPKAQRLVEMIKAEGGVSSICFNPGSDPLSGQVFQVGILQTEKGNLHLFNEYEIDSPADNAHLEKWAQDSRNNHHCCGCIIAAGASGTRRGSPTLKDILAFFEMSGKAPEDIGLAPLVMSYLPE